MAKIPLHPEVEKFFKAIGERNGKKLKEERGSEYFSRISKMRKRHGRQKIKVDSPVETTTITNDGDGSKL